MKVSCRSPFRTGSTIFRIRSSTARGLTQTSIPAFKARQWKAKGFVVRTAEALACAHLGEHGFYIRNRAADPLQYGVFKALFFECRTHLVVGKDRAVDAFGL